jgi:LEA14-like dessication related protein
MRLPRLLLPIVAFLVALTGCATDFQLSEISVSIVDIRPVSATALETQAKMTLRFTNANVLSIGVEGTTHKLYLNGTYVGQAVNNEPVGLPQLGTATAEVTIQLDNIALAKQLVQSASQKSVSYRLDSRLHVRAGDDWDNYDCSQQGSVDLQALAAAAR